MKPIDRSMVVRFVRLAGRMLEGDWVIMGGAVLPLVGIEVRITHDIDVAGPVDAPQMLELMGIAEKLGLPLEAVNQAGAFFLHRVKGWQEHLVPVFEGKRARIFRPDATLFVLLKLSRLSESDLLDCLRLLEHAVAGGHAIDKAALRRSIRAGLGKEVSRERAKRLRALERALDRAPDRKS